MIASFQFTTFDKIFQYHFLSLLSIRKVTLARMRLLREALCQ